MSRPRRISTLELVQLDRLRFFRHVFASAGRAMFVSDLGGRISHANAAAEQLYGYGPGELVGRSSSDLVEFGETDVALEAVVEAGGVWRGAVWSRRKRGAVFPGYLVRSIVPDELGDPGALVSVVEDDTGALRRRERLRRLIELGAALNAENDWQRLLQRICHDAREIFATDGAHLMVLDEASNELVGLLADGPDAAHSIGRRLPLGGSEGLSTVAARERRPVIRSFPELESAPEWARACSIRGALSLPLLRGDRLLGTLAITDSERHDRFVQADAEVAQVLADLAAVALEDARHHEAVRVRNERLLTLTRVNELLTESLERTALFDAIAAGAQRLLTVAEVQVWVLEASAGPLKLAHFKSEGAPLDFDRLDLYRSRTGEVLRSGRVWESSDLRTDRPHDWQPAIARGLQGALIVPLTAGDRIFGVLTMLTADRRRFGPDEVELARVFASQAALAVQNAERLERSPTASRVERLLSRARRLKPADREHVEQALATIERMAGLGAAAAR